jgi:hypothetical protein
VSIVYESAAQEQDSTKAATHALVIAVGDYPGLPTDLLPGLEKLSSPPLSACKFCDWLLSGEANGSPERGFHNPDAPLGSVDLLLSPTTSYQSPLGNQIQVDVSTHAKIKEAVDRWIDRLAKNSCSHGIFYFCGHGFTDGKDHFLLSDDFALNSQDPWSPAFNINLTIRAVIRLSATPLLFIIDACMEISVDLMIAQGIAPQGLRYFDPRVPPKTNEYVIMRGASIGYKAFAPPKDIARFTTALLKALSGYCGKRKLGETLYRITWPDIYEATAKLLNRSIKSAERKQTVSLGETSGVGNIPFHYLTNSPKVIVGLDVIPPGYRAATRVFVRNTSAGINEEANLSEGAVDIEVKQDTYDVGAYSPHGAFDTKQLAPTLLHPPIEEHQFPVP